MEVAQSFTSPELIFCVYSVMGLVLDHDWLYSTDKYFARPKMGLLCHLINAVPYQGRTEMSYV